MVKRIFILTARGYSRPPVVLRLLAVGGRVFIRGECVG